MGSNSIYVNDKLIILMELTQKLGSAFFILAKTELTQVAAFLPNWINFVSFFRFITHQISKLLVGGYEKEGNNLL
jgi:uncharacterized protein involved in cysteine biosynthesis